MKKVEPKAPLTTFYQPGVFGPIWAIALFHQSLDARNWKEDAEVLQDVDLVPKKHRKLQQLRDAQLRRFWERLLWEAKEMGGTTN